MMIYDDIWKGLKGFNQSRSHREFLFNFLRAYRFPEASISRLIINHTDNDFVDPVLIKNKLLFIPSKKHNLFDVYEALKNDGIAKTKARFILISNYNSLYAVDLETGDSLSTKIDEIHNYYDYFLPLIGVNKIGDIPNKTADLNAAEKLAQLKNILLGCNKGKDGIEAEINALFERLIFAFFADAIGLIPNKSLVQLFSDHSGDKGGGVKPLLENLFAAFVSESRIGLPASISQMPILPSSIYGKKIRVPIFNKKARDVLLEVIALNWISLNPDILGSLIQSTVDPKGHTGLNNHYTSMANTLKVLHPLFLKELYDVLDSNRESEEGLLHLLSRIYSVRIFDPSSGTGNFLIAAFKELRKLEILIKRSIEKISSSPQPIESGILVESMLGIESNLFKVNISKIGLWVASIQSSPIKQSDQQLLGAFKKINILTANPTRATWSNYFAMNDEIYIVCNPTYRGARKQTPEQKEDLKFVFRQYEKIHNLDYSACWVYLTSKLIEQRNCKAAFVVTNSITQGEQVGLLWPKVFLHNVEIFFAYTSFKWKNSSKGNTGVTVVILGLSRKDATITEKSIHTKESVYRANKISPYLISGEYVPVLPKTSPNNGLPPMPKGNMPYDDGNLILSQNEYVEMVSDYPQARKFIKKLKGSKEFIHGLDRWCLWIENDLLEEAEKTPPIKERIEKVRIKRLKGPDKGSIALAKRSHQFRETNITKEQSIIIPSVSSERRKYIPIGFVGSDTIISNLAFAIYEGELWVFGVLISQMHLLWIKTVCGGLETRIRYSSRLGYNTFPFPKIGEYKKKILSDCAMSVIAAREKFSEKSLAQIYDPNSMDAELIKAHHILDVAVENCYREEPFYSNQERLEYLFSEYKKDHLDE